ncbi:hypothetical protein GCK72_010074 [Caenorhabditis remanei]|uniref:26S proteasome non-ATPase regulatory subunit 5 n=1 Tax=Caenorhabditis remanei TaxID=31234 RepID=A0A6A5H3P0_CAERE|nr:hypothetical protein GCK72_010074 [Caenorhabditis remanei]KAF1761817.1 hypothetical protein GCK72_010074 [Caenorhabditis remanei]
MTNMKEYEEIIENWRNEYISNRNSKKGWEILENLAKLQMESDQGMETDDDTETADFDDFSTSKLISLIIGDIPAKDLLVDHQVVLLEFIPTSHPNVLRHVVRTIREKEGSIAFLKSSSLAVGIAIARRVTDNVAGEEIRRVLAHLVENSYICDDLKSQLNDLNGRNCSASRSRIYSIATERARISSDSSCIHWLYEEILKSVLDASDVLAQLDALDIFVDIALNGKQNAETLFKLNIVKQIYDLMEHSKESPDSGEIYLYGTRFLCYMARSYPQVLKSFPDFVRRLLLEIRMFDQLSVTGRLGAFDHFASLCFSMEAKQTLEEMFKANDKLAGSWYERLGGKALTHISVATIRKPFPELKSCVYDFWQQLFEYPTVVQQFIMFQGFADWALDEKSENGPEHELRKRQIIHRIIKLSENNATAEVINADPVFLDRLKKYLQPAAAPAPRVEEMAL